jgi:hypothetical protein
MIVNILGAEYEIIMKSYDSDREFKDFDSSGYCLELLHQIVLCDMRTFPGWENEDEEVIKEFQKRTLRHEIVHAFLTESGLSSNSQDAKTWAKNEEIIDWIALQGPKIMKAWQEAACL